MVVSMVTSVLSGTEALYAPFTDEIYYVVDPTYAIWQTTYTDEEITEVERGDLKPFLTGSQYTATNPNSARIAIKPGLSNEATVAGRFCNHRGQAISDYGMREAERNTGTNVVSMDTNSLIWVSSLGGRGFSYITCTTTPEYTPEQLQLGLLYSIYVHILRIFVIIVAVIGFQWCRLIYNNNILPFYDKFAKKGL